MTRRSACVLWWSLGLLPFAAVADGQELGVEDAVAAALASQPRLRAAEAEVRASAARVSQAGWQRLGSFETTGLYTPWQRPLEVDFPGIPNLVPPTSFEVEQLQTYAFTASLVQPLWTWGALAKGHAAARSEFAATQQGAARARQQTVLDAAQAFFVAASAAAAVDVAVKNVEQQQSFLRASQARVSAGSAARLDVLKAELAVAGAESALLTARNRDTLAREALVTVTVDGRFRSAPLQRVNEVVGELPSEEEALTAALAHRPDLAGLRRQGEALALREEAVRAAGLPALALRASLTQQNGEASRVFGKSGQIYQVGLALSWDAVDALRSRSKAAEIVASRDALLQGTRSLEDGIRLEVRAARSSADEARAQLRVVEGALVTAEEQARVARLAYREGATSALDARDAELGLTNARFALLRARLDLALSLARLRFAMGE